MCAFIRIMAIFARFNRKLFHRNTLLCTFASLSMPLCTGIHVKCAQTGKKERRKLEANERDEMIKAVKKKPERSDASKYQFQMRINWYFIFRSQAFYSFVLHNVLIGEKFRCVV